MLIFKLFLCNVSFDAAKIETVSRKLKIIKTLEFNLIWLFLLKAQVFLQGFFLLSK